MGHSPELTVTITGSGCPIPDANRAGPGVLVRHGDVALQFDAGRSTVQRLAASGLRPGEVTAVFITHHHCDHTVGLPDLVLTRWVMDRFDALEPLPIVAPVGPSVRFAERMLDVWADDITVRLGHTGRSRRPHRMVVGFEARPHMTEVWSYAEVVVTAVAVHHEPVAPAVAYRVDTPSGSVAISGDTIVCDEMAELARGVDVLVYEAMRFEPIEALPEDRRFILDYHADTRLIGVQAADLGVATLVLTHLIPAPDTDAQRAGFVADIRSGGYRGEVVVADDLDVITVAGKDADARIIRQ